MADAKSESSSSKERATGIQQFIALPKAMLVWTWTKWVSTCNLVRDVLEALSHEPKILSLLILSLNIGITFFNPFDFDDFEDRNQAAWLDAVFSPFYGKAERIGQKEITVVLLQQETLDHFESPFWPPSYETQARLIETLAQYEPAAIFLDFYYTRPHNLGAGFEFPQNANIDASSSIERISPDEAAIFGELIPEGVRPKPIDIVNRKKHENSCTWLGPGEDVNLQRFADLIDCVRHGNIANPTDETSTAPSAEAPLQPSNSGKAIPIMLGPVSNHPMLAPLRAAVAEDVDYLPGTASLTIQQDNSIYYPAETNGKLSAAFALYKAWCQKSPKAPENCLANLEEKYPDRLSVTWGYGRSLVNDIDVQFSDGCSVPEKINFSDKLATTIKFIGTGLSYGFSKSERPLQFNCLYHQSIPAQQIIFNPQYSQDSDLSGGSATIESNTIVSALRAALKDKIVLVGADLPWLADSFKTPLYGKVPGVAVHAMALDNLMEKHQNAAKPPRDIGLGGADNADVFSFIVTLFAQIIILTLSDRRSKFFAGDQCKQQWFAASVGVMFAAAFLLIFFGHNVKHWPHVNIIDSMAILFGSIIILEWFDKGEPKSTPLERLGPWLKQQN